MGAGAGHNRGAALNVAVPEWHAPPGTPTFNPYPYFRMRADDATLEEEARYPAWPLGFGLALGLGFGRGLGLGF